MALYREQVLPRVQDRMMGREPNRAIRSRVCEGLTGSVLEVGFGTGLNVRYYPSEVTHVVAIEPSTVCRRIAGTPHRPVVHTRGVRRSHRGAPRPSL